MAEPPLDGVRVLDLTWVLGGPFAGQLLAQLGADVIKVEPPGGDMARSVAPVFHDGESSFFLSVNRGKRGIALDLKSPRGYAVLTDLVRASDAVIYGYRPDVPAKLGIDPARLRQINPRICVGQIVGLHDDAEHAAQPAFDLVVQALGGFMSLTGEKDGPPVRAGYQIADLAGGLYLALGTLGALFRAARTGRGRDVQISLLDCQLALLTWQAQNYLISGVIPAANGSRHHMIAPSEAFRCADDRHLVISPTGDRFWARFCAAVGRPDLAGDARFRTGADRIANVSALAGELGELFASAEVPQWVARLTAAGVPAAPVLNVAEALDQPVARLRHMVETVTDAFTQATLPMVGNPFTTDGPPLGFPPRFAEHTRPVLAEVCGYSDQTIDDLADAAAITLGTAPGDRHGTERTP